MFDGGPFGSFGLIVDCGGMVVGMAVAGGVAAAAVVVGNGAVAGFFIGIVAPDGVSAVAVVALAIAVALPPPPSSSAAAVRATTGDVFVVLVGLGVLGVLEVDTATGPAFVLGLGAAPGAIVVFSAAGGVTAGTAGGASAAAVATVTDLSLFGRLIKSETSLHAFVNSCWFILSNGGLPDLEAAQIPFSTCSGKPPFLIQNIKKSTK